MRLDMLLFMSSRRWHRISMRFSSASKKDYSLEGNWSLSSHEHS